MGIFTDIIDNRNKPKRGLVDEAGSYSQKRSYNVGKGELGQQYLYRSRGGKGTGQGYYVQARIGDEKIYKHFNKDELKKARAYAKKIERQFKNYKKTNPKALKGKRLTVANQYAELFGLGNDFNKLNKKQRHRILEKMRRNKDKFVSKSMFDLPSKTNQEKIKNAFPDVKFDFKPGQKHGVPFKLKNGKINPVFSAVINFRNNNYVMSRDAIKKLPVSKQREIASTFELPPGVKEWNFDVLRGGNRFGIPFAGNERLYNRIRQYISDPKNYNIAADFGNAEGWLLNQMNRAFESGQNPNFIPKYDLVNGKKKIVAFTDNQYGGGKTYYALKKYAKKFNGTMMTEHPDFKNTKKYIDIAKRVRLAPNKVIKDLLIKGGVTDDRITLNNLLQYMINEKGVEPTKRALVLHHKGGVAANPTRDFQILNTAINQNITGVEAKMRADPKNITPKNIKFLKDAGASITIDGKTYGSGPKTAIGGFKQAEQFVQKRLESFGKKDFKNFKKYIAKLSPNSTCAVGRRPKQEGGAVSGLDECFKEGMRALKEKNINKPHQIQGAKQLMNAGKRVGANKFVNILTNLGVVGEVAFIAGDIGIRQAMGRPFYEAFLAATFREGRADKLRQERAGVDPEVIKANEIAEQIDSVNAQIKNVESLGDFYNEADMQVLLNRKAELEKQLEPLGQYLGPTSAKNISSRIREAETIDSDLAKSAFTKARARDNELGIPNIADYGEIDAGVSQVRPKERSVLPNEKDATINYLSTMYGDLAPFMYNSLSEEQRKNLAFYIPDREEQIYGFNPDKSLTLPKRNKRSYIPSPQEEEEREQLMSEVQGAKDGGLMNLTRTTPPKRSLNKDSQGLASLPEYDR